jgi:hypothetical protein
LAASSTPTVRGKTVSCPRSAAVSCTRRRQCYHRIGDSSAKRRDLTYFRVNINCRLLTLRPNQQPCSPGDGIWPRWLG